MQYKALLNMGIIPPLALTQKVPGKRDNSTDGEEPSSSAPSVVQPLDKDKNIMSEIQGAAVAAVSQPAPQQPAVVEISAPPAERAMTKSDVAALDYHARREEASVRMAELAQRQREWEAAQNLEKQRVAWIEADRSFVNRHLLPAAKFVGGTLVVFGTAALFSWLTGDSSTVTDTIPPV